MVISYLQRYRLHLWMALLLSVMGVGRLWASEARITTNVIPAPREVKASTGPLVLGPDTCVILLDGASPDERFAAELLRDELNIGLTRRHEADISLRGAIYLGVPAQSPALAELCDALGIQPDEKLGDQGYVLRVTPERAIIAANASPGVFYGVQTLLQLVDERLGGRKLLGVEIRDWPALKYRGIMDDISRGQMPKVETLKRMIRTLAKFKVNFFSPYIEDMFVFEKHPKIGAGRGALTAREFRELCQYAARYHVIIVPQFEAFGHQSRLLSIPEYKNLAETTGWSFAPANENTYKLLDDLIGEMVPAFPGSEFFGIGCDEVGDLGKGQSADMMKRLGPGGLFAYHIKRVQEILARYGRRPMMWGDMVLHHPEAAELIPKDVVIMDWHYGAASHYPSIEFFKKAGFDLFTCPAVSGWARIFPDYINALDNIEEFIREGQQQNVLGAMTCNWGDNGAENLIGTLWYGFVFAAECSWNAQPDVARNRFDRAFARQMYGMRTSRLTRAIKLLTETNRLPRGGNSTFCFNMFHQDPFAIGGTTDRAASEAARKLREGAARVIELLDAAAREGGDNHDIPYLRFAARRLDYVGRKMSGVALAGAAYQRALNDSDPPDACARDLREALALLTGLRKNLADLRAEFARLWLAENREPGLAFNLSRYDRQLASYDRKIKQLRAALRGLEKTGKLAGGEWPLMRVAALRAIKPQKGTVTAPERRARPDAYRVLVRLEANGKPRTNLPVHLQLNFHELLGDTGKLDPGSIRVFESSRELASQFVPVDGESTGELVWIAPGTIGPQDGRLFEVTFNTLKSGVMRADYPTNIRVTDVAAGARWVENSRYRILVGPQGAHFFAWQVKTLDGLDITQPGNSGWAGFNDVMSARTSHFNVEPVAVGPVVAVLRASDPWGLQEVLYFYADLPYVETLLSQPVDMYWNYDNVAVMAGDSKTPGMGRFSDGTQAPVPKSAERVHLTAGGDRKAWWSAKYRGDGFTLGLITPAEAAVHMVGPGGGWGGIGIEQSNPCRYFVIFADVTPDTWQSVQRVADTLSMQPPVKAVIGSVEPPRREVTP